MTGDTRCIAVFDSGLGGLTVVRELRRQLPRESVAYFGDTARVPYGIKSAETVLRFARENCDFLMRLDPKIIVVACNTASAAALPALQDYVSVPVLGVVEPGSRAAVRGAQGGLIAVIATESTVNSNAYRDAVRRQMPGAVVMQRACPLLVPMVEEGRGSDDPLVRAAVSEYLQSVLPMSPRALVLGCTHYPLIREAIAEVMGPDVALVDSAEQTALTVAAELKRSDSLASRSIGGVLTCYVSDNPQRFREVGQRFLGETLRDVTCVKPEEFFGMTAEAV